MKSFMLVALVLIGSMIVVSTAEARLGDRLRGRRSNGKALVAPRCNGVNGSCSTLR